MNLYHLFKVNDYKGGELRSRINMSAKDIIRQILEWSGYDTIEEILKSKEDVPCASDVLEAVENRRSIYAGADHLVFEIYVSNDKGGITEVSTYDFKEDLQKCLDSEAEKAHFKEMLQKEKDWDDNFIA